LELPVAETGTAAHGAPLGKPAVSILYALICAGYLALFEHNASWGGAALKTAPLLLLAAGAAWHGRGAWRSGLTLALLFSALGDFLLAAHGILGGLFSAGLGSFLVAQLCYAQLFWRHRSAARARLVLACAYLPVAAAMAWVILPRTGELQLPVTVYLLGITAMVCGAALTARPLWLFAGALCFAFSDASIAVNKFVTPLPHAGLIIMLSYYIAQWLLWSGALHTADESRT
jgi:uncharacterized membrane protein YhhN